MSDNQDDTRFYENLGVPESEKANSCEFVHEQEEKNTKVLMAMLIGIQALIVPNDMIWRKQKSQVGLCTRISLDVQIIFVSRACGVIAPACILRFDLLIERQAETSGTSRDKQKHARRV